MKVTVEDGTFANFVSRPVANRASGAAVVLLHEVDGVDGDVRLVCKELADHGFLAIAPNLSWREESTIDVFSSNDLDSRCRTELYSGYHLDRRIRDVAAIIRKAREADGASEKVGVMGFGLGGLLAYLAAARLPIDAAAIFYGIRIEEMLDEANKVAIPMLVHLGDEDEAIPPDAQVEINNAFATRGNVRVLSYKGSAHGFATRAGPDFDAEAASLALDRTMTFFQSHLR
jgi:carboxymethylenebutenolidase